MMSEGGEYSDGYEYELFMNCLGLKILVEKYVSVCRNVTGRPKSV
jgi:hypothetical protein